MPLDQKAIDQIAHLARLDLGNGSTDHQSIIQDLTRIVAMVDQISKADTDGIEPMAHSQETSQRLRSDEVTEKNERDVLLSLAPLSEAGLFLVPLVKE